MKYFFPEVGISRYSQKILDCLIFFVHYWRRDFRAFSHRAVCFDNTMIDLNTVIAQPAALKLISKRVALELTVLPIVLQNDIAIVAVPELFRRRLLADVQFILGKKTKLKVISASRDSIVAAIHRSYVTSESHPISQEQTLKTPYPVHS